MSSGEDIDDVGSDSDDIFDTIADPNRHYWIDWGERLLSSL